MSAILPEQHRLAGEVTDAIWNEGLLDLLGDYYATNVVRHVPEQTEPIIGLDANRTYIATMRKAFPDICVTLENVVSEGDWVAVRYTWRGTHLGAMPGLPTSGRTAHLSGMSFLQLREGKAVEIWDETNLLSMLQQLGALQG